MYCSSKTAIVTCGADAISGYTWGKKSREFYHCNTCGCLTHYKSTKISDDNRIAVNARMMSPADIADVKVRTFDGAVTWQYIGE